MTTSLSVSLRPQSRRIDGLWIRFAESDPAREEGVHALLLNPWPESLLGLERAWTRLAAHAHLVAVDLPGFGHPDGGNRLMCPRAMGELVVRLADAFGLERPHVVGLGTGTSAVLFAAALNPDRLSSLVVGPGGAAVPLQVGGMQREWIESPDLHLHALADDGPIVGEGFGVHERKASPVDAAEEGQVAYAAECFAESLRFFRDYITQLRSLRDLLPDVRAPVLIVAGREDAEVPMANATFLLDRLPRGELVVADGWRAAWNGATDEYVALVTGWWGGRYATVGKRQNGGRHLLPGGLPR